MGITECPHCHRRVVPVPSGECPSCNLNTKDEPVAGKGMSLLVVRHRGVFPPICFNCAHPVREFAKVDVSNVDAAVSLGRGVLGVLVSFGRLFSAFSAAKHDVFIRLRLPICDVCRKHGIKPTVQSYDLEEREVRLNVHKRFRDLVARE